MNSWFLPIRLMVYTLGLLALGACFSLAGTDPFLWFNYVGKLLAIFVSGSLLAYTLYRLELATWSKWEHRIITTLILFLLFDPSDPFLSYWFFFALGAITELLQRLIRVPGGPLFNPAALGAFTMSIFGYFPSWWGASFSPRFFENIGEGISVAAFITLPLAGYITYRYRKHLISIVAFITFFVLYFILFKENPLYIALEGTLFFFLLVMAIEPKTSPVVKKDQIIYGILLGTLLPLGIYFHWIEAYTIALLIANLYSRQSFLRQLVTPSPTQTPVQQ